MAMRQRYSLPQGMDMESQQHPVFASSPLPFSFSSSSSSSWIQRVEDLLWMASACFIVYYGDFHSNLFALLRNDSRIRRGPFCAGLACLAMDVGIVLYSVLRLKIKSQEEAAMEITSTTSGGVAPTATMFGLGAFILLCVALWPIWSFLTIPMLFTLFMTFIVMVPYLQPYINSRLNLDSVT